MNEPTASPRPRHRRHAVAASLITLGALAPAGALAQPAQDAGTAANERAAAVARDHHPGAALWPVTFTNPVARSRGPGAGARLL